MAVFRDSVPFQRTTKWKWHMDYQMVTWPMTSRDPEGTVRAAVRLAILATAWLLVHIFCWIINRVFGMFSLSHGQAVSCDRFLMQVIQLIVSELSGRSCRWLSSSHESSCNFLCQELSHLLLYVTHMFQSGTHVCFCHSKLSVLFLHVTFLEDLHGGTWPCYPPSVVPCFE